MHELFLKLLRRLPEFQRLERRAVDLEASLREAGEVRIRAQDHSIFLERRLEEALQHLQDAHLREVESREIVADFVSLQRFGRPIFGRIQELPAETPPVPIPPARIPIRKRVRDENAKFFADLINPTVSEQ